MKWGDPKENIEYQEEIGRRSWVDDLIAAVYGIDDQHLGWQKRKKRHKDKSYLGRVISSRALPETTFQRNPFIDEVSQGGYQEEKIKWEGLMGSPPSCPTNVAQQYKLGTKLQ